MAKLKEQLDKLDDLSKTVTDAARSRNT